MPEDANKAALRELDRLAQHPVGEPRVLRHPHLPRLARHAALGRRPPRTASTSPKARKILDEDHYDLEKVKDRILEYLAVRKLKNT